METADLLSRIDRDQLYRVSADIRRIADVLAPTGHSGSDVGPERVRSIIRVRRLRERYLGNDLFADPAWDMLLDLFAAELEGRTVSVSSLCLAAGVPPTTALRWISFLQAKRIIARQADSRDGRRILMRLASETSTKLADFLTAAQTAAAVVI